jgi:hypothetical protein
LILDVPKVLRTQALHCHSSVFPLQSHITMFHGSSTHQHILEQFTQSSVSKVQSRQNQMSYHFGKALSIFVFLHCHLTYVSYSQPLCLLNHCEHLSTHPRLSTTSSAHQLSVPRPSYSMMTCIYLFIQSASSRPSNTLNQGLSSTTTTL